MEATSNPTFKNFFHQLSQHLLQNHQRCQIIFCPTHQQQNRFHQAGSRSFWSMAEVVSQNFCKSSFLPIKTTLTLLLPPLYPRLILLRQSLPPNPTWTTKGSNRITSPFKIHYVTYCPS